MIEDDPDAPRDFDWRVGLAIVLVLAIAPVFVFLSVRERHVHHARPQVSIIATAPVPPKDEERAPTTPESDAKEISQEPSENNVLPQESAAGEITPPQGQTEASATPLPDDHREVRPQAPHGHRAHHHRHVKRRRRHIRRRRHHHPLTCYPMECFMLDAARMAGAIKE